MDEEADAWRASSARALVGTIERASQMLEDAEDGQRDVPDGEWSALEEEMRGGVARVSARIERARGRAATEQGGSRGHAPAGERFMCAALLPGLDRIESHGRAEALHRLRSELGEAADALAGTRVHHVKEGSIDVRLRGDDDLTLGKTFTHSWPCLRISLSSTLGGIERTLAADLEARCPTLMRCELLCSAPTALPILSDTIADITRQPGDADALPAFTRTGLLRVPAAVPAATLGALLDAVHERIAWAEGLIEENHADVKIGTSTFAFREIASRGSQRFDLLFDLGGGEGPFAHIAHGAVWMPLVRSILDIGAAGGEGATYAVDVSVVYSRPGAGHQDWHADGRHIGHKRYGVCVFVPLVDLDRRVGFTQFWLGSHASDKLLGFGGAATTIGADRPEGACPASAYTHLRAGLVRSHRGATDVDAPPPLPIQTDASTESWAPATRWCTTTA